MTAPAYQVRQRLKEAWLHILAAARAFKRLPSEQQGLETLTPVLLEPAQSKRYEQEMVRAMTNPHVRNIAITGGYGAGKSSLIRTFKENHRGFTYASVSLATFRKDGIVAESADEAEKPPLDKARSKAPDSPDEDVRLLIDRIEETIVQQLLYSVPATSLPRTRLKRIIQPSRYLAWLTTFCLSLAIMAGAKLYLFGANPPKNLTLNWLSTKLAWLPPSWALAMVFAATVWSVYQIVRSMSLLNIDGWSIKGGKIESLQHSSVLHKNVDEIIYCFQSSNINVVIIEDLDRFGIQDVFFRLREINAIVNESPQIKRDIRFIYALNDELFAGSEKTKFFDVVLPVVPVINKENSHAKMVELLDQRILDGKSFAQRIDDELVETVSYRVDDMRLVKNIVNELDIFANILATDLPLAWNKLFALIVIKNLHSDQYWQLSKRTGFLYQLISGYSSWRNKCSEELRLKIAEIERLQARKIKDAATSRSELRACVWYHAQLHANSHNASHLHWNGNNVSFMEFLEEGRFTELATASQTMQFVANGSRTGQWFQMPSVLLETNYLERLGIVEADDGELQNQIAATHEALRDLHKLPLSEALRGGYQEEYTKELTENETIRYLLVSGHLDEDYADYLGHFYGHAIGRDDMELVLKLRQGEVCDVQANIKDPAKLLKKIRPRNIDQGRGIIAELLLHLAISYRDTKLTINVDHLQRILDDAPNHLPRFLQSLDVLIERNEAAALIQAIFHLRSSLFSSILTGQDPSLDAPVPTRVLAVLSALELTQLKAINESDSAFKKRIEALHDVTLLVTHLPRTSSGWRWIYEAQVRFSKLNQRTSPEVLSELIELGALSPSLSMLRLVVLNGQQPAEHQPPVTISQLSASDRISGVREFITEYVETIISELVAQAVKLDESTDVVLMATKAIKDNEKLALRYFTLTSCSFPELDDLDPHLWDSAMRANRITDRVGALKSYEAQRPRTGDNLEDQIDERAIRIILSDYARQDAETLGRALWTGEEEDERLQEWIVTESNLDDEAILALTSSTVITAPEILTEAVSNNRLRLLAQHGRLELSESIWTVLAERDFTALASYVECHWNGVRLTALESLIDFPLAARLYLNGAMPIDDALRVFAAMGEDLLNETEEVLGHLAEQATKAGMAFQIGLAELASRKLQSGTYEKRWTMSLLVQAMPAISWPMASVALIALGGDLARLAEGRSVEIPHTDGVPRLLDALKARGFASSFSPGKNGTKVNMRRKLGDQIQT